MSSKNSKAHIVLFVEGDTDKVFFDALLNYYRHNSINSINSCEVQNLHGVSRYTRKVLGKLQNDICPRAASKNMYIKAVCCSYDTDVFEFAEQPVVNWVKVKKEVNKIGIKDFYEVKVVSMIEDWLLDDVAGLCSFLKLKEIPSSLSGQSGFRKIQNLFIRANKVYFKGVSIKSFISYLSLGIIRENRKDALSDLEKILKVNINGE